MSSSTCHRRYLTQRRQPYLPALPGFSNRSSASPGRVTTTHALAPGLCFRLRASRVAESAAPASLTSPIRLRSHACWPTCGWIWFASLPDCCTTSSRTPGTTTRGESKSSLGPMSPRVSTGSPNWAASITSSSEARQAETFRKMLLAMVKDIRVILVKLADRLHNMRTLYHLPDGEAAREIARETSEIYAPIALRLGMGKVRGELENLAFRLPGARKPSKRSADSSNPAARPVKSFSIMSRDDHRRTSSPRPAFRPASKGASSGPFPSTRS